MQLSRQLCERKTSVCWLMCAKHSALFLNRRWIHRLLAIRAYAVFSGVPHRHSRSKVVSVVVPGSDGCWRATRAPSNGDVISTVTATLLRFALQLQSSDAIACKNCSPYRVVWSYARASEKRLAFKLTKPKIPRSCGAWPSVVAFTVCDFAVGWQLQKWWRRGSWSITSPVLALKTCYCISKLLKITKYPSARITRTVSYLTRYDF